MRCEQTRNPTAPFGRALQRCAAALATALAMGQGAWAEGEWIDFWSADGTIIRGWLKRPSGNGPHPAIVIMHSCFGPVGDDGNIAEHERSWSDILTEAGYVVLAVDSYSPRGAGSLCQERERPVLARAERPWDAIGGLQFLQEQDDVIPDRVGIMGWSNGAISTLWTVRSGASAASALDGPDFRAAVAYYPLCSDVTSRLDAYEPRVPVLLQIGSEDDWTDPAPCHTLAAASTEPGVTLEVHEGAYHLFDTPGMPVHPFMAVNDTEETGLVEIHFGTNEAARERSIRMTLDWFDERLR